MPVAYEGPPTELDGLRMFLDAQREAILRKLDGLTDEQALSHPTVSDFCMLTLAKHVAYVERRWFQLEVARRDIPGLWVLLHLIEELARHAGQADIIRESIDGTKGA